MVPTYAEDSLSEMEHLFRRVIKKEWGEGRVALTFPVLGLNIETGKDTWFIAYV